MQIATGQPKFAGKFEITPKAGLPDAEATVVRANLITYLQNKKKHYDAVSYGTKNNDTVTVVIDPNKAFDAPAPAEKAPAAPAASNEQGFSAWLKKQKNTCVAMCKKAATSAKNKARPYKNYLLKVVAERRLFSVLQREPRLDVKYTSIDNAKKN